MMKTSLPVSSVSAPMPAPPWTITMIITQEAAALAAPLTFTWATHGIGVFIRTIIATTIIPTITAIMTHGITTTIGIVLTIGMAIIGVGIIPIGIILSTIIITIITTIIMAMVGTTTEDTMTSAIM